MAVTLRPPLPSPPPPGGREQENPSLLPRPHALPPVLATSVLPPVLATTSALVLALLALLVPLALADEAVRVVTWNLQTLGTSGTAPYQAVAVGLGRIDAAGVAIKGERQRCKGPTRVPNAAPG